MQPGQDIGVIHLEQLTEFDRAVTLRELRAAGVPFARNIVSGRSLDLREIAVILELAGLGVDSAIARAAEETGTWDS